jgi:hypothetical protein
MGNMSYCRFTNTVQDLRDCYENMDDTGLSKMEARSRVQLIKLCKRIADDYEGDLEAMEIEAKEAAD